jgi:hypothetical protein
LKSFIFIDESAASTFDFLSVDIELEHNLTVLALFSLMCRLGKLVDGVASRTLHLSGTRDKFKKSSAVVAHQSLTRHGLDLLSDSELSIR